MTRLLLPALLALAFAGSASAARYEIDANHTQVRFTYTHMGYSHITGRLGQVSGNFDFDPARPAASSIDVQVPLASLSTGVPKLDSHLSSADFFDAASFPMATWAFCLSVALFVSKRMSGRFTTTPRAVCVI